MLGLAPENLTLMPLELIQALETSVADVARIRFFDEMRLYMPLAHVFGLELLVALGALPHLCLAVVVHEALHIDHHGQRQGVAGAVAATAASGIRARPRELISGH